MLLAMLLVVLLLRLLRLLFLLLYVSTLPCSSLLGILLAVAAFLLGRELASNAGVHDNKAGDELDELLSEARASSKT